MWGWIPAQGTGHGMQLCEHADNICIIPNMRQMDSWITLVVVRAPRGSPVTEWSLVNMQRIPFQSKAKQSRSNTRIQTHSHGRRIGYRLLVVAPSIPAR